MSKILFILALDFDGTLYPIIKHDSEQMLALKAKESGRNRDEIDAFIEMDKKGMLLPHEFNSTLEGYVKGLDSNLANLVVDDILSYFDIKELDPLKEILQSGSVELAILSCGTDLLIDAFLERTGLIKYKKHMLSKELTITDDKFDSFIYHVKDVKDKAEKIKQLRELYPYAEIVAVGDGPTDMSMLEEADYPFLIDWNGKLKNPSFPVIKNFRELKEFFSNHQAC